MIVQQPCFLLSVSSCLSTGTSYLKAHTLLGQKQTVALLDGDAMPRVLVVWREPGGVCALADLAIDDFFERVDALARVLRVGDVHEMHACVLSV